MDERDRAREKLARAVKAEMEHAPLDKITVTQIVERAGLTRQTFYRNFQDKYDLVNWHFEQLAQKSFKQMGVSLTLREALIRKFEFLKGEGHLFQPGFPLPGPQLGGGLRLPVHPGVLHGDPEAEAEGGTAAPGHRLPAGDVL